MYLTSDQWDLLFWCGYSLLLLVTLLLAALGRKPVPMALVSFLLAIVWYFVWSFRFRVPSWSDLNDPNILWLVFMIPFLLPGSIAATIIGRIIFRVRHRERPERNTTTTSQDVEASHLSDAVRVLRRRAWRLIGVAFVIELGQYVYVLKDVSFEPFDIAFWASSLLGAFLFGWGSLIYARSKNFSPAWALLGITWMIGGPILQALSLLLFLLLASAGDRTPQAAVTAGRSDT
jgi:hypothetical protein